MIVELRPAIDSLLLYTKAKAAIVYFAEELSNCTIKTCSVETADHEYKKYYAELLGLNTGAILVKLLI